MEDDFPKRKQHLIPRLEKKQVASVVFIVTLLVVIPITKYVLERVPLYQQSKAKGFIPTYTDGGMVTTGLTKEESGPCRNSYRLTGIEPEVLCTHGPDPAPPGFNIHSEPSPLLSKIKSLLAQRNVLGASVTCEGDGSSGKRVEVVYAHASNVVDRFSTFQTTFQQYVADTDSTIDISAAETGGSRHIRFVHSPNCAPIVTDVTLSPSGDDTLSNTISELNGLGLNKISRKYIVFVDAHMYCGIATLTGDDTKGNGNGNNLGPSYARIDAGCWSTSMTAHELMHMLGGVQLSAPHSSGGWHCTDEYDRMCYSDPPSYPTMEYICSRPDHDVVFDCNHDDYFSTNPQPGTYLATHWNSANNEFLIGATDNSQKPTPTGLIMSTINISPTIIPAKPIRIVSMQVGSLEGKEFTPHDSFGINATIAVKLHLVDKENANLSKALVVVTVVGPDGSTRCSDIQVTDADGAAISTCTLSEVVGQWSVRIDGVSRKGYDLDTSSVPKLTFTVH